MSKKKNEKLLLNLLEGERYKHRVAMVTDEGAFNQHEPNSNMARMFVVMLLIHVVVIGGIIIYDFMNGEASPKTAASPEYKAQPATVLPGTTVGIGAIDQESSEEYSTYEWKSGDSLHIVAETLQVPVDTLIKLNKLEGRQININDLILYPKRPLVKAVPINVAGANGELAKAAVPDASIQASEVPINLAMPGEPVRDFGGGTIIDQLTPAPTVAAHVAVQDSPPPAVTSEPSGMPVRVDLPKNKVDEAPPAPVAPPAPKPVVKKEVEKEVEKVVPKAIPFVPSEPKPMVAEKPPVKKILDTPPPAKKEPVKASGGGAHTVQSGDTLYRIASKHGISVAALQAANKNAKPESLKIGMKLVIPRK